MISSLITLSDMFKKNPLDKKNQCKNTLRTQQRKTICVCDISAVLNMTVSAFPHQLKVSRNMKLVKHRKNGKIV